MRLARTKNLLWAYGMVVALGIAFGVLALGQLRATTGQLEEVVSGHAERVPFYRVPGSTVRGTGIGLATVHRIVQAHHGSVSVRSEVGRGAAFTVRLPLREEGASSPVESSAGNFSPPPPCPGET